MFKFKNEGTVTQQDGRGLEAFSIGPHARVWITKESSYRTAREKSPESNKRETRQLKNTAKQKSDRVN
jgi:hypothetical protein